VDKSKNRRMGREVQKRERGERDKIRVEIQINLRSWIDIVIQDFFLL